MSHIKEITSETSVHDDLVPICHRLIFLLPSCSALRLARQHAQPLSSETDSSDLNPQSYFTSGLETASLQPSDGQTAFLSGIFFSEVIIPTPVPEHIRIPAEHSRSPTCNFADYPIRVGGNTIYNPKTILFSKPSRTLFLQTMIYSLKKETELKRLQLPNLELKFEVKVKFQCFNPHPLFHVAK